MLKEICLAVCMLAIATGFDLTQSKKEKLEARINHLEEIIEKLQQQIENKHQVEVESRFQQIESENYNLKVRVDQLQQDLVKRHENQTVISFTAYATEDRAYDADLTVLFDATLANYGNFYNPSTSIFICPVNGYYLFSVHINTYSSSSMRVAIEVDSVTLTRTNARANDLSSTSIVYHCPFGSLVRVVALYDGEAMYGGSASSVFSGTLLFPA